MKLTDQKKKFSVKDFLRKCKHICSFLKVPHIFVIVTLIDSFLSVTFHHFYEPGQYYFSCIFQESIHCRTTLLRERAVALILK